MKTWKAASQFLGWSNRHGLSAVTTPSCGFSLLELLVVVSVIAIVASVLLPSLARAKGCALRVKCANNIHQLGVALRLYVDDYQRYPCYDDATDIFRGTGRSRYWDAKLLTYLSGAQSAFMCPANTGHNTPSNNWTFFDPIGQLGPNQSYGYNGTGTASDPYPVVTGGPEIYLGFGGEFYHVGLPEARVSVPAEMIVIADFDPMATDDDSDYDRHAEMLFLGLTGLHAPGANVLFCDSHVEYGHTNRWRAKSDQARQRWNYDHQAHLELR